jgi:hypothetical protein
MQKLESTAQLSHLNVPHCYNCFEDDNNVCMVPTIGLSRIYFITPNRFTGPETHSFTLISACHYMHTHQVMRRDLELGYFLRSRLAISGWRKPFPACFPYQSSTSMSGDQMQFSQTPSSNDQAQQYWVNIFLGCCGYLLSFHLYPIVTLHCTAHPLGTSDAVFPIIVLWLFEDKARIILSEIRCIL